MSKSLCLMALAILAVILSTQAQAAQQACSAVSSGFMACTQFTYSGGDQTFTVPNGVYSINIRTWGAGGGGGNTTYWDRTSASGSGGFSTGTLAVTPGQVLTIRVGQGGLQVSSAVTYGGGGGGGAGMAAGSGGGSGGGYSGVFTGSTPLLISGGGGGASPGSDIPTTISPGVTYPNAAYVGSGGGLTGGQDPNPQQSGRGGTQTAGGAAATQTSCNTNATSGSSLQGGMGGGSTTYGEGGGGGGGGYFGGGGGACQPNMPSQNGGGGGGSSYIGGAGLTGASTTAAPNATYSTNIVCVGPTPAAANTNDQYVAGTGIGVCNGSGGNGLVVLQYNYASVKVQKVTVGGTGTFSFSQTNLSSTPASITTTAANTATPASPTENTVTTLNTAVTLTETPAAGYVLSSASCTDANSATTGNTGSIGSLSGNVLTIPAANVKAGAVFTCTFTNTKRPTLTITKISQGNTGSFTFTGNNGWTSQTIATTASGTATSGATQTLQTVSTSTTITEALPAGWVLSSVSCTGMNGGAATVSGNSFTLNAAATAAGNAVACTVTNTKRPTVKVQKTSNGGTGSFTFSQTNLATSPGTITTATAGTATPASPTAINVSTIGTAVTLTEGTTTGFGLTAASCTDANAAITGNSGTIGTLSGSTLTIPATAVKAGADFTCSFTNTTLPSLRLTKSSQGGGGNFTFTGTNGWTSQSISTASSTVPGVGVRQTLSAAGTATTITETLPAGWQLTGVSCTGMGSGSVSVSGNSFTLDAAAMAYGNNVNCTITNAKTPTVKVQKISYGGTGTFSFSQTNLTSTPAAIATVSSAIVAPSSPTAIAVTTMGASVTLTEAPAAGFVLTSASCSDDNALNTGNPATFGSLSGTTLTIPAANVIAGADITCRFLNSSLPTLTLTKVSQAGTGSFTFTGNNGWSSQTITTATAGTGVSGAKQTLTAAATSTTITETLPSGWALTGVSCSGMNGGGVTISGNSFTLDTAATAYNNNVTCTVTNSKLPTLTLTKISQGGTGNFTFTGSNGWSSQSITTVTAGTGVTGATQTLSAIGAVTTLTETLPSGWALTGLSCTGMGTGSANFSGNTITLTALATAAGNNINCTVTNSKLPTLTMTKVSLGGTGSFDINPGVGSNGWTSQNLTTSTADVGVTGATQTLAAISTLTTLTETMPSGWSLTNVVCTGMGAGGVTFLGNVMTLNATATAPGNNISCTVTNTKLPTLTLTKVTQGGTGSFTLSTTNGGSSQTLATTVAGTGVTGATQTLTFASTTTTITETIPAGWSLTSANCTGMGTGTATVSSNVVTLDTAATAPGNNINCTITNSKLPTLRLTKISQGGTGSFSFTGGVNGNGWTTQIITTTASGTSASGATQTLSAPATATTISETILSGWVLSSVSCSGMGSGSVSTTSTSFTLDAAATAAGNTINCTITNIKTPTLKLKKVSNGAVGTFSFSQTNLASTPADITTTAMGVATPASPTPINISTIGTAVTLTETPSLNFVLSNAICTDTNASITGNNGFIGSLSGTTMTINGSNVKAGADITCTFTNTKADPKLTAAKSASPANISAAGETITYTMNIANTGNVVLSNVNVSDPMGTVSCPTNNTEVISTIVPSQTVTCTMVYTATQSDFDNNSSYTGLTNTVTASTTYNSTTVQASASANVSLNMDPQLTVVKSADTSGPVSAGQVITYSFIVTNTGNLTLTNVNLNDTMNTVSGHPTPSGETLYNDQSPTSDSSDASSNNGSWSVLAPGDSIKFTATYTVTTEDVETLQ